MFWALFLMEILEMANRRLNMMSGGRYELVPSQDARRPNGAAWQDVDVQDHMTLQEQLSSGYLSGGESFFTFPALALGLSDVVQSHAGSRQLDALFIDEGFGTLSDGYLDRALDILNQVTEGNCLEGIISYVDKLSESIYPADSRFRNRKGKRNQDHTEINFSPPQSSVEGAEIPF